MNSLNSTNEDLLANPETESNAAEQSIEKPPRGSRAPLYIAYLALFFTAVGITVGYKHWVRIHDKAKHALYEIEQIKKQLHNTAGKESIENLKQHVLVSASETEEKLNASIAELDKIREQTTYSARSVKQQIAELTVQQNSNKIQFDANRELQLSEARFLLNWAQRRLQLDYDKTQALKLLQAADKILIELGSPELLPVRDKLAADIAALELFKLPATVELAQQIAELKTTITPLLELDKSEDNGEKINLFDKAEPDSLSGKVKGYINRSVEIRKLNDSPRFILNNHDKKQIDHLLALRLESMRIMVMQRHDREYHQDIESIKSMLKHYYPAAIAEPWLQKLNELDAINLRPELPGISSALEELSNPSAAVKS